MNYCCAEMEKHVVGEGPSISYSPRFREYFFPLGDGYVQQIGFCPWCRIELPTSLRDEWGEQMTKKFGEAFDPTNKDRNRVPVPFKSDQWWRSDEAKYNDDSLERYCCRNMLFHLTQKERIMEYDRQNNVYCVRTYHTGKLVPISFCPWCMVKLSDCKRTIHKKSFNIIQRWDAIPGRMLHIYPWKTIQAPKTKYCCGDLEKSITSVSPAVFYRPYLRDYSFMVDESKIQQIEGCPWCGKTFPANLSEEWWNNLDKLFGEDFDPNEDAKKIPEEFKTDEWWRKQGLEKKNASSGQEVSCCQSMVWHIDEGIISVNQLTGDCFVSVRGGRRVFIYACPFCSTPTDPRRDNLTKT